jgi:hypothetical protein
MIIGVPSVGMFAGGVSPSVSAPVQVDETDIEYYLTNT